MFADVRPDNLITKLSLSYQHPGKENLLSSSVEFVAPSVRFVSFQILNIEALFLGCPGRTYPESTFIFHMFFYRIPHIALSRSLTYILS